MKPGEVQTFLPPPPHKIVEYLNGHIIGHSVMKKAISVAVYNHFCAINFNNNYKTHHLCHEEALVDDAKHYFNREYPSVAKIITDESVEVKFDDDNQEYLSPVVARVIIEAASHKVRLRRPNVLTFDSTGHSKPVNAISSTIAQLFEIPFIKCDCSTLSPIANVVEPEVQSSPRNFRSKLLRTFSMRNCQSQNQSLLDRRKSTLGVIQERRGSLTMLLEGCDENKETINSVISKLYRKAEFDLSKAQRAIVFLDGMDKIGANANISENGRKQVLKEILQVLDGITLDVTRAGSTQTEYIDTSKIFFVVFGNFEEKQGNGNQSLFHQLRSAAKFNQSPNKSSVSSDDSGNGSGETYVSRRHSMDQRSEDGYNSDDDESIEGLKENKLAQNLIGEANPIAYYQSLWGMKDVQLKFTPEALEVIANQATLQNAGQDGIEIILEKLFLNLKFDLQLNNDITSIEINEDVVMGKKRPNYIRKSGRKRGIQGHRRLLSAIDEELQIDDFKSTAVRRPRIRLPSRLTEYDMAILEQLEI